MRSVFTILLFLLMVGGVNSVSADSATPVAPEGQFSAAATDILSIRTSDGSAIPAGTTISVFGGPTLPISPAYSETLTSAQSSPYMVTGFDTNPAYVYNASAENAAGYQNGNSGNFNGDVQTEVLLQKVFTPGTLTIRTSDGGDIPAGTWISVFGGPTFPIGPAYSETLTTAQTSPYTVTGFIPAEGLVYNASAENAIGYQNGNSGNFNADVSTEVLLQVVPPTPGTLTISTVDGGVIPAGTTITVMGGASSPIGVAYTETLATDQTSPYTVSGFVPNTDYVYQVYVESATGYANANSNAFDGDVSTNVELQVATYTVTLNVTTSDGGDIPAGTSYAFTDSLNNTVLSGTVAADEPSPWQPTITDVLAGEYTLTITNAAGYQDLSQTETVSAATTTFDVELQVVPPTTGSVALTITTEDGGAIPTGASITVGSESVVVSGAEVSGADEPSGSTFTFSGLAPGTQPVQITNAAPYADFTGSVVVTAGEASASSIELILAAAPGETPTATPTLEPGASPSPSVTPGTGHVGPGNPQVRPTATATEAAGDGTQGEQPAGGVTQLPSTGQGSTSSGSIATLLMLAAVALLAAGALAAHKRVQ